jgi:hypothetical protein
MVQERLGIAPDPERVTRVALVNVVPTVEQFERMGAGPSRQVDRMGAGHA